MEEQGRIRVGGGLIVGCFSRQILRLDLSVVRGAAQPRCALMCAAAQPGLGTCQLPAWAMSAPKSQHRKAPSQLQLEPAYWYGPASR